MLLKVIIPMLKRKRYGVAAGIAALLVFGLSYYLIVFNINGKSITAYAYMNGVWYTIASVILTLLVSVLSGVYLALWLLRRDLVKERRKSVQTAMGAGGALAGVLAAGCPTCGAPLLALLGAPLALMSLPFKGLEIKLISAILVFLSIYWLAENVYRKLSHLCQR